MEKLATNTSLTETEIIRLIAENARLRAGLELALRDYEIIMYPDERIRIPKVGDVFVVTEITDPVIESNGERSVHIELSRDTVIMDENIRLHKDNDQLIGSLTKMLTEIKKITKVYLVGE